MEENNKVLILDNEEMVLETIEMFFPSEEFSLFTTSSLDKALSILEEQKPSIIVSNANINEASGRELIDSLKERKKDIEIILMSDLDYFKDILAEYGTEVSDVIYKPIDMDILEIIIKRAQERHKNRSVFENFSQEKETIQDENSNLNTQIIELQGEVDSLKRETDELKSELANFENTAVKESETMSAQKGDLENKYKELSANLTSLHKNLDDEKNLNALRMHLVVTLINAMHKSISKTKITDIFTLFEEALVSGLKLEGAKISKIDDAKRIAEFENILKNNQLALETKSGAEVPFKIGNTLFLIKILGSLNVNNFSRLFHLAKELIALVYLHCSLKSTSVNQLEEEKKKGKVISSVFANVQLYIKKSMLGEKVTATKDSVAKLSEDILNLVFSAQEELNKDSSNLETIKSSLDKIVAEKAQLFDIAIQKLSQVKESLDNVLLGITGKRMKQVSGDQYLFAKERKQI